MRAQKRANAMPDERREQMLQAAVDVIGERGFSETRISDVGKIAGSSPALVIYYFGTKDGLLTEALRYSEDLFYAATHEAAQRVRDCSREARLPGAGHLRQAVRRRGARRRGGSGSTCGCRRSGTPRWRGTARSSTAAGRARSPLSSATVRPAGSSAR